MKRKPKPQAVKPFLPWTIEDEGHLDHDGHSATRIGTTQSR